MRVSTVIPALCAIAVAQTQMKLIRMTDKVQSMGARCLDGSPGAFYWEEAKSVADKDKWIIHFNGGAWCYTEKDCAFRAGTSLGSTADHADFQDSHGLGSGDCEENPDFCNWNKAHLVYCDGTSFAGEREDPIVVDGKQIWFRGRRIRDAVLETLKTMGLVQAREVLLSGCSAGSVSAYLHTNNIEDWLRANVPTLQTYKMIGLSGMFLEFRNIHTDKVLTNQLEYLTSMANTTANLDPVCTSEMSWRCQIPVNSYKYIRAPAFVMNSVFDSYSAMCLIFGAQDPGFPSDAKVPIAASCDMVPSYSELLDLCQHHGQCEGLQADLKVQLYITEYIQELEGLPKYQEPLGAAMLHGCMGHCEAMYDGWSTLEVGGVKMRDAVGMWWHGGTNLRWVDPELRTCKPSTRGQRYLKYFLLIGGGCLILCILIVVCCCCLYRCRKRKVTTMPKDDLEN